MFIGCVSDVILVCFFICSLAFAINASSNPVGIFGCVMIVIRELNGYSSDACGSCASSSSSSSSSSSCSSSCSSSSSSNTVGVDTGVGVDVLTSSLFCSLIYAISS